MGAVRVNTRQANRMAELAGFSVLEVGGAQLGKEEDGQNQVDGGKHHIVDHRLDLGRCSGPGAFDGAGHIPGTCGESCGRHQAGHCQDHNQHHDQALIVEFTHKFPPLYVVNLWGRYASPPKDLRKSGRSP